MTAKELRDKLRGVPNDANVFLLIDTSDANWDSEKGRYIRVEKINDVYRERVEYETGMGFGREINVIIEMEEKK